MAHEHHSGRRHPEFIVLEIGDEIGALIVHADPGMHGVEIEISPTGHDERRTHKEVLERAAGERPAFTAVFDQLPAGSYTLWSDGIPMVRDIQVGGAEIAELGWPGASAAPT